MVDVEVIGKIPSLQLAMRGIAIARIEARHDKQRSPVGPVPISPLNPGEEMNWSVAASLASQPSRTLHIPAEQSSDQIPQTRQ